MSQIASEHQVHPMAVGTWKKQLLENSPKIFSEKQEKGDKQKTIDELYKIIGQREVDLTWIKKNLGTLTHKEKTVLIDKASPDVSLKSQAELMGVFRSLLYYKPVPISQEDVALMNLADQIYTKCLFYGTRRIKKILKRDYQTSVGRPRLQHLMKLMAIEAIYPKPKTSKPNIQNQTYQYLLRNWIISRPNQVWGTDITYIKLNQGFCYLVAITDWYSRYVISWEVRNSLEIEFTLENLTRALKIAKPEIHNPAGTYRFADFSFSFNRYRALGGLIR